MITTKLNLTTNSKIIRMDRHSFRSIYYNVNIRLKVIYEKLMETLIVKSYFILKLDVNIHFIN